jgi:hypothetical protein
MDSDTRTKIEAAAFRGLVEHLQKRPDIQNIDLMNLSGFCRNCLAKWLCTASLAFNAPMDYAEARTIIYGMPYKDWKDLHQVESTEEQRLYFEQNKAKHADTSSLGNDT